MGHDSAIRSFDLSRDGTIVATGQEGKNPCVKIWEFKSGRLMGTIPVKLNEITSVSLSYNNKLVAVSGADANNKDTIIIWNYESIETSKKAILIAKQVSEFNILSCKFSPIETDKLVSCGKENIRYSYNISY